MRPKVSLVTLLTPLLLPLLSSCRCDEEQPFTPFEVATELPGQPSETPTAPEPQPASEPVAQHAVHASREQSSWRVFDRTLHAPEATFFETALPVPESDEVVAWVGAPDGSSRDGLWLFDAAGKATRHLAALPSFLPGGRDCERRAHLEGADLVTVEVRVNCKSRLLSGTPTGAVLAIDKDAKHPIRLALRLLSAAPGESIDVKTSNQDLDEDGRPDFQVTLRVGAPSGRSAAGRLRWLNRPAGLSRLPDYPRKDFDQLADQIVGWAGRPADADLALETLDAVRRLTFSACAESGTAKVLDENGDALACGGVSALHSRLSVAAVDAHLTASQPTFALAESARHELYFGQASERHRMAMRSKLLSKLPNARAKTVTKHGNVTMAEPFPVTSPLRYDKDGGLWLLEADGSVRSVSRSRPAVGGATASSPQPWPLRPVGPGGLLLGAALPSCDRSEVQLSMMGPTQASPVPIDMLAPRPGSCGRLGGEALQAIPLGWQRGQLRVIVEGQPLTTGGAMRPPKSPIAWTTPVGLAVWDEEGIELWTSPSGLSAKDASHCAIRSDKSQAACILEAGGLVLAERPEGLK